MQLLDAGYIFQAIMQRKYLMVHTVSPILLASALLLFGLFWKLSDRRKKEKDLCALFSSILFFTALVFSYCFFQDARIMANIKANKAETCGTTLLKVKGSGRTGSQFKFDYAVEGVHYEGERMELGSDTATFDGIASPGGYYVIMYNKLNPRECILDASRRLAVCE